MKHHFKASLSFPSFFPLISLLLFRHFLTATLWLGVGELPPVADPGQGHCWLQVGGSGGGVGRGAPAPKCIISSPASCAFDPHLLLWANCCPVSTILKNLQ